jgi:flagellar basal-body rod protein FlgF
MLRGIYAAASGMDAATEAHSIISRNLAHAAVPGYRRVVLPFSTLEVADSNASGPGARETIGTKANRPETDFTQGVVTQTGNPLDVALSGDGFFVIQGPTGPLYTRSGAFMVNAEQQIVTADGLPVLGEGGPLQLPGNGSVEDMTIAPDGSIRVGSAQIGKLKIVAISDPQRLESVGATLFRAPPDAQTSDADAQVIQGSRELSNVSAVSELVHLIAAQRHYEASQRTLTALDRTMQRRLESN